MYSIVITTYECNGMGVSLLKDNIDAVVSQTYRPIQCVVSDHSQNDEIEKFLKTYDMKDVEFVYTRYHEHYGSPSHNWNNAISFATGNYIHPIAMDERLYDSSSVQRIVDFMRESSAQWIGIPCVSDPTGVIHTPSWNPNISTNNTIGGTGSVVIRDTLKYIKFDTELTWLLDTDWYTRLEIAGGKPDFLPLPVGYIVRLHPLQLTNKLTDVEKSNDISRILVKYQRRAEILNTIRNEMNVDTDISSHLDTIWLKSLEMSPKKIVELGVRGGESSRILGYVVKETQATLIGVDIEQCSYPAIGTFIHSDDVAYANTYKQTYGSDIDVLMIDTSHYYDHTCQEISAWFPLLSKTALVIFHDTNMMPIFIRKNGSVAHGWDNQRGVIRAIEEFFATSFDETKNFNKHITRGSEKWYIEHDNSCSGLTLCRKY